MKRKNLSKQTKKARYILKILSFVNRVILYTAFLMSMVIAFAGYHNTDMCANGMILNAELDGAGNFGETYLDGSMVSFKECYRQGMIFILMADIIMLTFMMVLMIDNIRR